MTAAQNAGSRVRIVADRDLCQGYVCCVMEASDIFDIDDDNKVVLLKTEATESEVALARAAVRQCPVAAISLIEE